MTNATLSMRLEVARPFRLQWEAAQDAWVLLYPEGMVKLNQSAGEIMQRCDGSRSLSEVILDLERAFEASDLEADVLAFARLAIEQGWLREAAGGVAR